MGKPFPIPLAIVTMSGWASCARNKLYMRLWKWPTFESPEVWSESAEAGLNLVGDGESSPRANRLKWPLQISTRVILPFSVELTLSGIEWCLPPPGWTHRGRQPAPRPRGSRVGVSPRTVSCSWKQSGYSTRTVPTYRWPCTVLQYSHSPCFSLEWASRGSSSLPRLRCMGRLSLLSGCRSRKASAVSRYLKKMRMGGEGKALPKFVAPKTVCVIPW